MENSTALDQARMNSQRMGQILLPVLIFIVYGVYRITQEGIPAVGWPNGLILVLGGVFSAICASLFLKSIENKEVSWRAGITALSGIIPYVYFVYIIFYVGAWTVIQLFTVEFSMTGLLIGFLGVVLGYRGLNSFYQITELANQNDRGS